jgi:hypothetical protein
VDAYRRDDPDGSIERWHAAGKVERSQSRDFGDEVLLTSPR